MKKKNYQIKFKKMQFLSCIYNCFMHFFLIFLDIVSYFIYGYIFLYSNLFFFTLRCNLI